MKNGTWIRWAAGIVFAAGAAWTVLASVPNLDKRVFRLEDKSASQDTAIAVMQNDVQHIKEQTDKISSKMDEVLRKLP